MFFNDNKQLFENFTNKIIHIIVDDLPYKYHNVNIDHKNVWNNEYFQRNAISRGINYIKELAQTDLIIISDLDEIPDPNTLETIKKGDIIVNINILEMDMYYYNLNTYLGKWYFAKILPYNILKNSQLLINDIRNINTSRSLIFAGWHLSYFADIATIQNKILNFSHQEFNSDTYTNLDAIAFRKNNQCDLFNRREINITKISHNDNKYLPYKYNDFLIKYIEY